jgi:hypothetical protein
MATTTHGEINSADIAINTSTSDPTVNNDSNSNYAVGSLWVNTSANTLWVCTDASVGAAVWKRYGSAKSRQSWSGSKDTVGTDTIYLGGYYELGPTSNDFDPALTGIGSPDNSAAAHVFIVIGAVPVSTTTIRVSGVSIDDEGNRNGSDSEDITVPTDASVSDYFETSKKWLGEVTIDHISGTIIECNFGFAKYFDNENTDFTITGIEATWWGGADDSGADILLRHHKTSGWTYNAGSTPTPPTALASMSTDHGTEDNVKNAESGAWKRVDLNQAVDGSGSEGVIIELQQGVSNTWQNFINVELVYE